MHISFDDVAVHLTPPLSDDDRVHPWTWVYFDVELVSPHPDLTPLSRYYPRKCRSHRIGLVKYSWRSTVPPKCHSQPCNFKWLAKPYFPVIQFGVLDLLSVNGPFHECVTLVKHLIVPPDGFMNAPYRRLNAVMQWRALILMFCHRESKEVDPVTVMSITLSLSYTQETVISCCLRSSNGRFSTRAMIQPEWKHPCHWLMASEVS